MMVHQRRRRLLVFLLAIFSSSSPVSAFATTRLPFVVRGGGGGSKSNSRLEATTASKTDVVVVVSTDNLELLSDRGRAALENLMQFDAGHGHQAHVYGDWPEAGTDDEGKIQLTEQLADLDGSYPGGLPAYLGKAKQLLKESAEGLNPFEEYEAVVPEGVSLHYDDDDESDGLTFEQAEQAGVEACAGAVFVLVAGGLGERLGYSGIKLELETNLCDDACYLEFYVRYILALQSLARETSGNDSLLMPLAIMTSGDTDAKTRQLLQDNNYFGMEPDQLSIVMQDKVAALQDGTAGLALSSDSRWSIQTKPHGHGDVHHLLLREGLVDQWLEQAKTHVVFLQDTNALVVNSVLPTLGVSVLKGFHMNSICIPRLAGEAAGAIARLEHKTDPSKSLVINVEYNQLDPLLRAQGDGAGDVPDQATGYSPFPGNANNLVLELSAYAKTLKGPDQGVVVEFVNPKYKDETRTAFKKPTRLECMMQDIPKLFQKEMGQDAKIGFTMLDRWFTFSPAKNALEAGQEAVAAKGKDCAPGTMSSAESDLYVADQRKVQRAGGKVVVSEDDELCMAAGIAVTAGPRVLLCPSFGITLQQQAARGLGTVTLASPRSSLVLSGNVQLDNVYVDGALVINVVHPDATVTVRDLKVENQGWELQELDPNGGDYPEHVRIRGYTMNKKETAEYVISEPSNYVIDASGQLKKEDS